MADSSSCSSCDHIHGGEIWLAEENQRYATTAGVSANNRGAGFIPAYRDERSGRVVTSRFADGRLAPIHVLEGLPAEWVVKCDRSGAISRVIDSVVAGFVFESRFFTRDEAHNWIQANCDDGDV